MKTSSNHGHVLFQTRTGRTANVFATFFGFSDAIAPLGSLFAKSAEKSFLGSRGDA